jgi:hypothetical protein
MNDAIETLAIGLTLTMIFSIPFAFFAYIRYLRYKETITLAERGLLRPTESKNGRGMLRWGIVFTFIVFALSRLPAHVFRPRLGRYLCLARQRSTSHCDRRRSQR